MTVESGRTYTGRVTGVKPFGAFVKLPDGKTGLVHISEVAESYVKEVSDFVEAGQNVQVKVLEIKDDGKIALSMKQAGGEAENRRKKESPAAFEEKMNQFLKDSEERLSTLRSKTDDRKRGDRSR
ncbi:S1 RNA-binding domain-containing protein [Alkalicoccus luteus]|uniref:S1 RNA-binding domain-containing protein n=1 Tax=Alkalicoccus luteus TaxID=1237094 RepID=A0A969PVB1_9BACI|nr:S1 RNA-binding domain-containing protein [Alkalicoccus luteus]NJP39031.1 S1 RNA-binding domain-containing protein [Alkalicoccus luteus]